MFPYFHLYLELASVPVTHLATKRGEETESFSFTVLQNTKRWWWHHGLSLAKEPTSCCTQLSHILRQIPFLELNQENKGKTRQGTLKFYAPSAWQCLFQYATWRLYHIRQCFYIPRKKLAHNQSPLLVPLKRRLESPLCCVQPCTHICRHTQKYKFDVCWTVHHCDKWRMENQLDATCYFIVLLIGSKYFGHYYAHHQELATMMLITTLVVSFLVFCRLE